jgi:hypothetical protein
VTIEDPMYLVTEGDGTPIGFFDLGKVDQDGTDLAFKLAAIAGDEPAVDKLLAETLARVGAEAYGFTAASALRTVIVGIVSGLTDVAEVASPGIRQGLINMAEGRDPNDNGR